VVSLREIHAGEELTGENIWVKRPGTGAIKAIDFESLLGKIAKRSIPLNTQLSWEDFD